MGLKKNLLKIESELWKDWRDFGQKKKKEFEKLVISSPF